MKKTLLVMLSLMLVPAFVFAADGQVLINQATVMAAGGFPYRITQPGSYKLSGNLVVGNLTLAALTTHGILITTDDVTLDLNGFSIQGPYTCTYLPGEGAPATSCSSLVFGNLGDGVHAGDAGFSYFDPVQNGRTNITIINGTISGFGGNGVIVGPASRVENLQIRFNGLGGIAADNGSVVKGNRSRANGGSGFVMGGGCVVEGNTAFENGQIGFVLYGLMLVDGNSAFTNAGGPTQVPSLIGGPPVFVNNSFR